MTKASAVSTGPSDLTPEQEDELLLEAARRANWEATHGPAYLRSGRFFISELHEQHRFRRPAGQTSSSARGEVGPL